MKSGGFQVKSSRFQVKSSGFCVDFMKSGRFQVKSTYKTYKSNISRKTLQFYGVLWEGYVMFSHEIRRISKDQLPGMVSPMFLALDNDDILKPTKEVHLSTGSLKSNADMTKFQQSCHVHSVLGSIIRPKYIATFRKARLP